MSRIPPRPTLPRQEWLRILREHEHRCYYCREISDDLHQEHKMPHSRGGPTDATNIVPACRRCNMQKGARTEEEFLYYLAQIAAPWTPAQRRHIAALDRRLSTVRGELDERTQEVADLHARMLETYRARADDAPQPLPRRPWWKRVLGRG